MGKELNPRIKELIKKYELNDDPEDPYSDVFISSKFKIITRTGIDKIQARAGIQTLSLDILFIDPFEVIMRGCFSSQDSSRAVITTASASIDRIENFVLTRSLKKTLDNGNPEERMETSVEQKVLKKGNVLQNPPYLSEMAEKRCISRGVLKLTGFYDEGIYGEDEADDFKQAIRDRKYQKNNSSQPMATVKSKTIQ